MHSMGLAPLQNGPSIRLRRPVTGPKSMIWATILLVGWPLGCWACTRTAQHLRVSDPGAIVWDEIWAFWLMLWLIGPVGWLGHGLRHWLRYRPAPLLKPRPSRRPIAAF